MRLRTDLLLAISATTPPPSTAAERLTYWEPQDKVVNEIVLDSLLDEALNLVT